MNNAYKDNDSIYQPDSGFLQRINSGYKKLKLGILGGIALGLVHSMTPNLAYANNSVKNPVNWSIEQETLAAENWSIEQETLAAEKFEKQQSKKYPVGDSTNVIRHKIQKDDTISQIILDNKPAGSGPISKNLYGNNGLVNKVLKYNGLDNARDIHKGQIIKINPEDIYGTAKKTGTQTQIHSGYMPTENQGYVPVTIQKPLKTRYDTLGHAVLRAVKEGANLNLHNLFCPDGIINKVAKDNNIKNPNLVYPGQEIKVYSGAINEVLRHNGLSELKPRGSSAVKKSKDSGWSKDAASKDFGLYVVTDKNIKSLDIELKDRNKAYNIEDDSLVRRILDYNKPLINKLEDIRLGQTLMVPSQVFEKMEESQSGFGFDGQNQLMRYLREQAKTTAPGIKIERGLDGKLSEYDRNTINGRVAENFDNAGKNLQNAGSGFLNLIEGLVELPGKIANGITWGLIPEYGLELTGDKANPKFSKVDDGFSKKGIFGKIFHPLTKIIGDGAFCGVADPVLDTAKGVTFAALNTVQTIPDATIGCIKPGRFVSDTIFNTVYGVTDLAANAFPGGDASQRVHSVDLKKDGAKGWMLVNNFNTDSYIVPKAGGNENCPEDMIVIENTPTRQWSEFLSTMAWYFLALDSNKDSGVISDRKDGAGLGGGETVAPGAN